MFEIVSKSTVETKKIAELLVKELPGRRSGAALVFALSGELGSGKTTFVQGFAKALGIKEKILSPTFLILKIYGLPQMSRFRHLAHIDCYRLDSPKDLAELGFKNMLKDSNAIILIEWAERIKRLLPDKIIRIKFRYGRKENERILKLNF